LGSLRLLALLKAENAIEREISDRKRDLGERDEAADGDSEKEIFKLF
jgi:hypothetical protein